MEQVEEFENYKIIESAIQFKEKSAVALGCIGEMNASSNVQEVVKKCEGKVIKRTKRTEDMTVEITTHARVPVSREIIGLSNKGLKKGVYAYGTDSFSDPFTFTAKVLDMEGNVKFVAFPNVENVNGLSIKVNNEQTEIEMDNFNFSALADSNNKFYYEAFESELEDETVKTKWLTNFTPELVKEAE